MRFQSPRFRARVVLALSVLSLTAVDASAQEAAPSASEQPAERPAIITLPVWARTPMPQFPARAIAGDVREGRAAILCDVAPDGGLSGCQVKEEVPLGFGFGEAALAGTARARLSPRSIEGAAPGVQVMFPVRFILAGDPPRLSVIEDPSWARSPRPAFPRSARRAGITSARVRLDCQTIRGTGRLRNCVVKEEDPAGHGFGQAAIRAVRDASIAPRSWQQAAPDAHAVFTVTFAP